MSDYLIESLDFNIKSLEEIFKKKDLIEKNNIEILKTLAKLENQIIDLKDCKGYYSIAVNEIYETSIKALKDTLDTALQFIIFDRDLSAELILEDKRGTKTLNISIRDNDCDEEIDIKEGTGMGIATIISFVLKLYYLINKDSKILLLDEKYSNVSVEYMPKFFEFMCKMTDEKDFIIIIISHDERFTPYVQQVFQVSKGSVTRLTR